MDLTTGYTLSFPVFSGLDVSGERFKIEGEVLGTAFSLGDDFMITAGHVLREAQARGHSIVVGLSQPDGFFKAAKVTDSEQLQADISIFKVNYVYPESRNWFHGLKWRDNSLNPYCRIRSVGYGFGMHTVDDEKQVIVRGFEGHIVSVLSIFKPIGWIGKPFEVYELSFLAPCGMSGAPLLNSMGNVEVQGIIIGNSQSKMLVFRHEEKIKDSGNYTSVEQYEVLNLGIAVTAKVVLQQNSRLLGGSIRDYLTKQSLIEINPVGNC